MENNNFTYPKKAHLKSKTTIDKLFIEGSFINNYPLRLVYLFYQDKTEPNAIKTGVSTSKRYFKKAVDRNLIKRRLREAYRLNQQLLSEFKSNSQNKSLAIMIMYNSKDIISYRELNEKLIVLLRKLKAEIESNN